MSVAFASIFDSNVVENIVSFYQTRPEIDWETVYGSCTIYRTKHYITYGGGPEGGFVYLFREHEAGWYRWHRDWGTVVSHTRVEDGVVAFNHADGGEQIGVLPHDWEDYDWDDYEGEMAVMGDDVMQEQSAL